MSYPPSQKQIGSPFIELQTVDSTNNYALALIRGAGLPEMTGQQTGRQAIVQHGSVVFAHEQIAGKGQRGRNWASARGENIAMSILLQPALPALSDQFQLSVCTAVAVCKFFEKYAGDETKIKWPNDLYWKDRKAGGILIESVIRGSIQPGRQGTGWEWAVVGIGINVNQVNFPGDLPNPVSLRQITGRSFQPAELALELCQIFDFYYEELIREGFDAVLPVYLSHFYKKDQTVRLRHGNRVFEAIIRGITPGGRLVVEHGIEEQFDHGELQWLL